MRTLFLMTALFMISCTPAIPLSETIMFPQHERGNLIVARASASYSKVNTNLKKVADKKFGKDEYKDWKYVQGIPMGSFAIATIGEVMAGSISAGLVGVQGDVTVKFKDDNYITGIVTVNKSCEGIIQKKVGDNNAVGFFALREVHDGIRATSIVPIFYERAKHREIIVTAYGGRYVHSIETDNFSAHFAFGVGYSPNFKCVVVNTGLTMNGSLFSLRGRDR